MNMPDYLKVENPGGYGIDFNTIKDHTKTRVSIKTLDSFEYTCVSFIKIDVEGAEMKVLLGAKSMIVNAHPTIFLATHGDELHAQCISFLTSLGYKLQTVSDKMLSDADEFIAYY